MSALHEEILAAVRAANAPLVTEITQLRRQIEEMQRTDEPEYVTVKRAAELLSLTEKTVHRHCDSGRLEVIRIGGRKMVKYSSLVQAAG